MNEDLKGINVFVFYGCLLFNEFLVDFSPPLRSAGGSLPVCFSYFSEFQPNHRRGAMISALATFWMAGNIVAAGPFKIVFTKASL